MNIMCMKCKSMNNNTSIESLCEWCGAVLMPEEKKPMTIDCPSCHVTNDYTATMCTGCSKPLGRKFDEGKTDWTLAPWEAFECIIKVMMFGAKKYARGNWKHVQPPSRYIAATYRHLNAWSSGDPSDKETGFSHLWHAGCCITFAIWLELKGKLSPKDLE